MGMAAILVMWPRPREHTFIPPSHWGSIWNLALIDQAVLEKKIFENGGRWTDDGSWLYFKLSNEPKGSGELKINSSETVSGLKLKLGRIVHDISLYKNIVFYFCCLSTLVAMATFKFL